MRVMLKTARHGNALIRLRWFAKSFSGNKLKALLIVALCVNLHSYGQVVNISADRMPLKNVFEVIKKQTGYSFFGRKELFAQTSPVTVEFKEIALTKALDSILKGQPIQYRIQGTDIILSHKTNTSQAAAQGVEKQGTQIPFPVTGSVYDAEGIPLQGASVVLKRSKYTVVSDAKGHFDMKVEVGDVLSITYVGYTPQEITIDNEQPISIKLRQEERRLNDMVVTGIVNRKADSYTGAVIKITKQELLKAGSVNIFQSLKNIEPSLYINDNLVVGSDPNKIPDMQIRGESSFPDIKGQYSTNPNQPLFIVDGFEWMIDKVSDLDMNRISSITILKDASAKALYGSRAANGVIVIETEKVKPGELRVSYTGTVNVEMPDLNSYNLTNSAEKLDLEKRLGAYNSAQPIFGLSKDSLYYANLQEVQNGVNTDWLSQPVRIGIGSKHTVNLEAGDERLRAGLTFFTNNIQGVMKGSERQNVGGAFSVVFRYKKVLFRNIVQYTNVNAKNSPYGNFADYALLNPYWRPYNSDGSIRKLLGVGPVYTQQVYNPLYNASLNSLNASNYADITNNTYLELTVNNNLRIVGRIGITNTVSGSDVFVPGSNTKFASYTGDNTFLKGSYDKGNGKASMVSSDLNMNYSKSWGKHSLFTNVGANIREDKSENYLYSAVGFPSDKMNNIMFAYQYAMNLKPSGSESDNREVGFLGIANYSYDSRYFADVSTRYTGSSQFGSNNKWGSFWSLGAGWNVHNEKFFRKGNVVSLLKLRGSLGYTGSQNFSSYQALSLYSYFVNNSYQGQIGTYLNGLANPDLKWQQRMDYNVGMDAELFKRLSLRVDVYKSITDNLLTDITTPPSMGFNSYKANLGQIENTGLEFKLNYRMFVNNKIRRSLNFFVAGASNNNRIIKISNSLKSITDAQDKLSTTSNKPLVRFQEGQSLDAIWAVRSMGIDPATGKEIFIKQDGTLTNTWNVNDKVVCGINQPKLFGNAGMNFEYKGFSVGLTARYRIGGQIYNQTLVDKVENAQLNYNVDKRAYYNSWKQPGDVVLFKSIGTVNSLTLATSRFVQNANEFSLSSMNVGYDFYRYAFIKKLNLQRLQVMFNMNEMFTFSSVQVERGTSYPFARTCSFTLMANF